MTNDKEKSMYRIALSEAVLQCRDIEPHGV